jgi:hypothetical protein
LSWVFDHQLRSLSGELQYPSQLTYLNLYFDTETRDDYSAEHLGQLSALVNLEHLCLGGLSEGLPGGVPSQLVKLTTLQLVFCDAVPVAAEQLQSLSFLTALQQLSVGSDTLSLAAGLPGIMHLAQLSSLRLCCHALEFSTSSTRGLASLTALQSLDLAQCEVQPAAVAALTQLRALKLKCVDTLGDAPLEGLLMAVSALPLLT